MYDGFQGERHSSWRVRLGDSVVENPMQTTHKILLQYCSQLIRASAINGANSILGLCYNRWHVHTYGSCIPPLLVICKGTFQGAYAGFQLGGTRAMTRRGEASQSASRSHPHLHETAWYMYRNSGGLSRRRGIAPESYLWWSVLRAGLYFPSQHSPKHHQRFPILTCVKLHFRSC